MLTGAVAVVRPVDGPRRKGDYRRTVPEFVDRFGPAYKAELAEFIERCLAGQPFAVTHRDAANAQEVISAGMETLLTEASATRLRAAAHV